MCTTSIKLRVSFLRSLRESRPANKDISVTLHSFCLQTFSSDSEIPISTLQRRRGELQPKAVGKILTLGKHLEPVHSLTRGHWVLSGGFPYCSCNNAAAFLQATATHTHTHTTPNWVTVTNLETKLSVSGTKWLPVNLRWVQGCSV